MTTTLTTAATTVLDRLGDAEEAVWTRAEIALYLQDGYDTYTRDTGCLFDRCVIENLPVTGNWQTDFERYLALQHSGWTVTDDPMHMSAEHERNLGTEGRAGSTYRGPATATDGNALSGAVPGGTLPDTVSEVLRVTYDQRELTGMTSMQMRQLDPNYETRSGDPQFFVLDKDGINYLRVVPAATGTAVYPDTEDGPWGTFAGTTDPDVTPIFTEPNGFNTGGFGILVGREGAFPAFGPWGTPARMHPTTAAIEVDILRTGRPLIDYPFEIPPAFEKYVYFYAMARCLSREGPGQDLKLAAHFDQRFAMGLSRMNTKVNQLAPEEHHRFRPPNAATTFGIGDPRLPTNYPAAFGGS